MKVRVPSSELSRVHQLKLNVTGYQVFSSYKFSSNRLLSVRTYNDYTITFVQTDKPMYQPGEMGKYVLDRDSVGAKY